MESSSSSSSSSGSLPLATYHRASQVGAGSFGSVLTVYNDSGEEYALKVFDDNGEAGEQQPIDLGALREISCLRLLRQDNGHANIVAMVDVQASTVLDDEDDEAGAGTAGCLGMALPLYRSGSLAAALTDRRLAALPRRVKAVLAHGLLCAVAFLHDNGILHRDIKSDNVLIEADNDGGYRSVLIDFSLAKPIDGTLFADASGSPSTTWKNTFVGVRHTGEVGTVTYTAPEIFTSEEPIYGKPMDLWSVGVVLLEVWQDALLTAQKNTHALKLVQERLTKLVDKPFPQLLRGLLQTDPSERWSARQSLQADVFAKFQLGVPGVRILSVAKALPIDHSSENQPVNASNSRRHRMVERLCVELGGATNPLTVPTALEYAAQMEELDDELDDIKESSTLLDCVVLAFRFWERDLLDLEDLEERTTGSFASWNQTEYTDNEATIFLMLDYCLYPRRCSSS
jgi:serine/threonine protein kinase